MLQPYTSALLKIGDVYSRPLLIELLDISEMPPPDKQRKIVSILDRHSRYATIRQANDVLIPATLDCVLSRSD